MVCTYLGRVVTVNLGVDSVSFTKSVIDSLQVHCNGEITAFVMKWGTEAGRSWVYWQ